MGTIIYKQSKSIHWQLLIHSYFERDLKNNDGIYKQGK